MQTRRVGETAPDITENTECLQLTLAYLHRLLRRRLPEPG